MAIELGLLAAVVIGLVELVKRLGMPVKYAPLLAVILGVFLSILMRTGNWEEMILGGIIIGLTSVGLFSGVSNVYKGFVKKANV